jgi:hypothetical protein
MAHGTRAEKPLAWKGGRYKTVQEEAAEARRIRKLRAAATRNRISNRKFEMKCTSVLRERCRKTWQRR